MGKSCALSWPSGAAIAFLALCLALLALPARADEAVDPYQMIKTFKTTPREPMTVVATPVSAPAPMPPAAPHK